MPQQFEIKSTHLSGMSLVLKPQANLSLATELRSLYGPRGENAGFFGQDPVVLDLAHCPDFPRQAVPDLLKALRECQLQPVAQRNAAPELAQALLELGLAETEPELARRSSDHPLSPSEVVKEVVEVVREVPGPSTLVVDKPLRSGQKVYARGADLVLLAMVNQGAEVAADGHIHVYAPLRGRAMAGARGNTQARIFALSFEPELVSIAGVYRTSENPFPDEVRGKAAHLRLSNDGQERLIFEPLKA